MLSEEKISIDKTATFDELVQMYAERTGYEVSKLTFTHEDGRGGALESCFLGRQIQDACTRTSQT